MKLFVIFAVLISVSAEKRDERSEPGSSTFCIQTVGPFGKPLTICREKGLNSGYGYGGLHSGYGGIHGGYGGLHGGYGGLHGGYGGLHGGYGGLHGGYGGYGGNVHVSPHLLHQLYSRSNGEWRSYQPYGDSLPYHGSYAAPHHGSYAAHHGPAVGVFNHPTSGYAVPLLLSCEPNLAKGNLHQVSHHVYTSSGYKENLEIPDEMAKKKDHLTQKDAAARMESLRNQQQDSNAIP